MRNNGLFRQLNLIVGVLLFASVVGEISAANYVPADNYLLNCGGPDQTVEGRKWTTDNGSMFALAGGKSLASDADTQKPSVPQVPYMTARIFKSEFTYSIPVASGRQSSSIFLSS